MSAYEDLVDTLCSYSIYYAPGLIDAFIDHIAEKRGMSREELLKELGISSEDDLFKVEVRKKVVREAVRVLGVEYVAGEAFYDLKYIYEHFMNYLLRDLIMLNTEKARELVTDILNDADNLRVSYYNKEVKRYRIVSLRDFREKWLKGEI